MHIFLYLYIIYLYKTHIYLLFPVGHLKSPWSERNDGLNHLELLLQPENSVYSLNLTTSFSLLLFGD